MWHACVYFTVMDICFGRWGTLITITHNCTVEPDVVLNVIG